MEGSPVAIPTNSTIPLTDVVRAGISSGRIAMPVRGVLYARLPTHQRGTLPRR